ncbi:YHS domain-containing (seleno)protein [Ekhidna sp. To15]|uniref:YHS domain-containing (seleno)protein n=1 Tax=Ekhidna sp. To15 TaxID=3395267 RepID=UPI003F528783
MKIIGSILLLLFSIIAFAQKSPIYTTNDGAIKGYDPVAYFVNAEPVKGKEAYSLKWMEADWYFSSQENLDAFKADPEKYAPQFGGYCAYAVGNGYTYRSDPKAWKIVDNKLYLNYSKGIQKKWEANQTDFIKQGEANWPKVIE